MPLLKPRPTFLLLAAIALALAALTQTLHNAQLLASSGQPSVQRSHSDAGGQTASPNPSNRGSEQEERVRQILAKQYDEFYTNEKSIRQFLNIRGKTADFLGHNTATDQWVIAESKASDLDSAWSQLKNTAEALLRKQPSASVELRLYVDEKTFDILDGGGKVYGWMMDKSHYLGWPQANEFAHALIEGVKIMVLKAP